MRYISNIALLVLPIYSIQRRSQDWKINTNCLGTNKFVDGKIKKDEIESSSSVIQHRNQIDTFSASKVSIQRINATKLRKMKYQLKRQAAVVGSSEKHLLFFNKETNEMIYVVNYSHGTRKFEGKCF